MTTITPGKGIADANDLTISGVAGTTITQYIIFHDSSKKLIAYFDTSSNLPVTPNGGNITLFTSRNNEALAKLFMESFNRNTKYKGYNMISKPIYNSLNQACLQSLSLIPKDQQEFIIPISIE